MVDNLLSTKYLFALELVALLFADHKRDMGNVPFVTHLFGVARIVQQLTDDENTQLAALLHDVLEDIPPEKYSAAQMRADFGSEVLALVQAVSYDEVRFDKDESRRQYVLQLAKAPANASIISGADMLHNGRDFLYWFGRDPQGVAEKFGGERTKRRDWFWRERLKVIESKLGAEHRLVRELHDMFRDLEVMHQKLCRMDVKECT
jgi:HD domain-containing protein